ncbi:MAG: YraN family protein [Bacteroidetes bacterium]|jgi:putative endonuclease|nr:YraN family protein [Bacteroidota bacterium]
MRKDHSLQTQNKTNSLAKPQGTVARHLRTGQIGEELAAGHLARLGYVILERNWRHGHLELDMIAQIGNDLVFVEVKTLRGTGHGYPESAVTKQKARRLFAAAEAYLIEKQIMNEIRFDIVAVILHNTDPPEIYHIEDALHPYGNF